jgi:PAS domain S-box-containing protein
MKGFARLALLACLGTGFADASERLNIGVLVETGFDRDIERWEVLAEHLGQSMADRDIEVEVYGFEALEQAIQRRAVDLVITNGSHYISMSRRVGLSAPIASIIPIYDEKPLPGVGGTVLVDAGRLDLITLEDLRGTTVAAASRHSLAYHAAAFETIRNRPDERIGYRLIETGLPHEQAVRAILAGDADAAFVRAGVLEAMVRDGSLNEGATRVLNPIDLETYPFRLSTALYPDRLVTVMPQLDKSIAELVTASLLQLPKGGNVARSMGIHGFTLPYSYEPVADMARTLRLPPYANPAPVSLRDIWRDHSQWLISLATAIVMIIGLVLFLVGYAARLRESRAQTRERIKEQSCLYDIFEITEDITQPLDDMMARVADRLPSAFQHPELAGARIIWQDQAFRTDSFSALGSLMSAALATADEQPGRIDISYPETLQDTDGGPFLSEERALLEAIGSRIGTVLQRRALEDAARQREQIYRAIFALAADAITLVDCETLEFIEFNDSACRQLGYSRDEFFHLRLPDIQGEFDESTIRRMIEEFRLVGETHFDTRRKCKDGKLLTVHLGLSFLEFRGRSCMSLIWTDVTEQRDAEARLRESEHRFRRLFKDVRQPVLLLKDGRFVDVNRAALELMLLDDWAQVTGRSPADISPRYQPDGEASSEKATRMIELARQHGSHRFEWEHLRPDGTCFTAEVLITPIEISGEDYEHIIWTDISARKQAETALREKESEFRHAIESSPDGFWAVDRQGHIVEVNQAYCSLSGYSRDELLTMSIKDIDVEHEHDELTRNHMQTIVERGHDLFETTHRAKGGRLWPVEVAASFNPDVGDRFIHSCVTSANARWRLSRSSATGCTLRNW